MKLFLSFALFCFFLFFPAACADGVRNGLALAAGQALPALFPFFVAGGLLTRSGLALRLSGLAARPLYALYRLPPTAAPAVLLGLTGGYPVGAATTADLLKQGTLSRTDAARVNRFCNCASPGFCIALAGLGVFGSARTGAMLYGIHVLSALLTGLITAREDAPPAPTSAAPSRALDEGFASIFCAAVQQAAATALTVTAFLAMFSILLRLAAPVLALLPCGDAFSGLFELTAGLDVLTPLPLTDNAKLTIASFLLGFGGLAVQFQVRALAAPAGLPVDGFAAAKLLHGALAAALTALLTRLSPQALVVSAAPDRIAPHGLPPVFSLILLLAALAIWSGKKAKNAV